MIATVAKRAYDAAYKASHKEELRAYGRTYYRAHREERLAYSNAYNASHKDEMRAHNASYKASHRVEVRKERARFTEWIQILRSVNGCADCETHEGRLDHHHVDPGTKKRDVSRMYSYSLDSLEDELEKCVVLCRSCHKYRGDALKAGV